MLLKGWFASLESRLPEIVSSKNPLSIVALQQEEVINFAILRPYNRRGTCWSLEIPEQINAENSHKRSTLNIEFLQKAMLLGANHAKSWIFRSLATNTNKLSLARELGFQPLKYFQYWTPPRLNGNSPQIESPGPFPERIFWEKLTRKTAPSLLHLEKTSESTLLRQILDKQSPDLFDQTEPRSGVLLAKNRGTTTAIAGLIGRNESGLRTNTLKLVRDSAWDDRIEQSLPKILFDLAISSTKVNIETSLDDKKLNNFLSGLLWEKSHEEILLGKSLWRRKLNHNPIQGTKALEGMLGHLQPQSPPLPTPSIGRD